MKRAGRLLLAIVVLVAAAAPWLAPNPPAQVFDDLLYAPPTPIRCTPAPSIYPQRLVSRLERLQSQAMAEAVRQPFLAAAAARGVAYRDLILQHAWRVSLRPICAVYGLVIGALLSGSFVVEFVTDWPGLGQLMYEALRARDIYLVTGCAAMGAFLLALGTLIGDLLLATVDPRTRETEAA